MKLFGKFVSLMRTFDIPEHHLVYVGAHAGQRLEALRRVWFRHITMIEPNPYMAAALRYDNSHRADSTVLEVACSDKPGWGILYETDPSDYSTMVEPKDVQVRRELRVRVETVASALDEPANVAVIDVQGYESRVIAGCPLDDMLMIVAETTTVHDPVVASHIDEVESLMNYRGFTRVDAWPRSYAEEVSRLRGPSSVDGEVMDTVFVKNHLVEARKSF